MLTRTLSYAKGAELMQLLTRSALSPRGTVQVDVRTNTLIITRPAAAPPGRRRAHHHARPCRAAGRDRSAHRPDEQELRARARRAVGLQRPRGPRARQHDEPGVSEHRQRAGPRRRHRAGPAGTRRTAVNLPVGARDQRRRSRARRRQRRVQPRRRAERARAVGQRPDSVDAARLDAEQRRSGDDAGRPDSAADDLEQHGDRRRSRTRR